MNKLYNLTSSTLLLKVYLESTKNILRSLIKSSTIAQYSYVNIILGNESGDLDSVCSALFYGYANTIHSQLNPIEFYVPIINIKREEIFHRFEIVHLFNQLGLDLQDLNYLDDFDLKLFIDKIENSDKIIEGEAHSNRVKVTLIDHNVLSKKVDFLKPYMMKIIDHHDDQTQNYYNEKQCIVKNIEKIGSASTLVYNEIENLLNKQIETIDRAGLYIILTTIIVDTFNLDPKLKNIRWTDKDEIAARRIKDILEKGDCGVDSINFSDIYNDISNAKFQVDLNLKLGLEKLFIKDYKVYDYPRGRVGYSIFFVSYEDLSKTIEKMEFLMKTEGFFLENKLNLFILFFVHPKDKKDNSLIEREIILYDNKQGLLACDVGKFMENENLLIKKIMYQSLDEKFICYKDINSIYTRKIIEPIVCKFMS